jgi:UPF0755 protein
MHKLLNKLVIAAAIVMICAAYMAFTVSSYMHTPLPFDEPVEIELQRGAPVRSVATQLQQKHLLQYPDYFMIWVRLNGVATRLQAGEYSIQPGETLAELVDDMVSGRVRQYALTLVEGWTFSEVLHALQHDPILLKTLDGLDANAVMSKLGHEGEFPEGRFFPDTYFIHRQTTDIELLQRAYRQMAMHLQHLWDGRDPDLPFENPYSALILASIVEKESALAEERPQIAGVFINRLRKGMRLQTDPTVIYGLGDSYDGNIRFRDLRKDTPYNTYTRNGLPPTPIAMPGLGALKAVMHPQHTDHLYFVAYGDGSGRHQFSSTLAEHEKAVDLYQRKHKK